MKQKLRKIILPAALLAASAGLYTVHYAIFQDARNMAYYLMSDIAFLPLEALIAILVLDRILEARDRQSRLDKLNMVIGAFFSETGAHLLTYFSGLDPKLNELSRELAIRSDWTAAQFDSAIRKLRSYPFKVSAGPENLSYLKGYLVNKREFLLRLLENPMVLEHEKFTKLLQAVFHLTEELAARPEINGLPATDTKHLTGDIERAYLLLVSQWVSYVRHLGRNYPFLFSFALRTNPFDTSARVIVQ
jgi:hypothetical protein